MYLCTHRSTQVASPTLSSGSLYMATHLRKHCSVILRAREKRKSTHPECCNAAPRLISPPGRVLHSSNRHRRGHRWRAQEKRSVEASAAAHLLNISVIASSSVCCAACMLAEKKTDRGTSCCVGRPRVCRGTTSTAVTVIARVSSALERRALILFSALSRLHARECRSVRSTSAGHGGAP
jgi:hypothetical protein